MCGTQNRAEQPLGVSRRARRKIDPQQQLAPAADPSCQRRRTVGQSRMKSTSKLVTRGVAILVLASMGVMFVVQQQALKRVRQQNGLLQQQVDELTAEATQLAVERERVSKLIAVQEANAGSPLAPEPSSELLRLRGEVGRLRLQERESEQPQREQMQAAQAQIPNRSEERRVGKECRSRWS